MKNYIGKYFESSCYKTPEFLDFAKAVKKSFKKAFTLDKLTFNVGHFYISWFINRDWKCIYFSISDVRPHFDWRIMYRTAENEKDFHGWSNHWTTAENYIEAINTLFLHYN